MRTPYPTTRAPIDTAAFADWNKDTQRARDAYNAENHCHRCDGWVPRHYNTANLSRRTCGTCHNNKPRRQP